MATVSADCRAFTFSIRTKLIDGSKQAMISAPSAECPSMDKCKTNKSPNHCMFIQCRLFLFFFLRFYCDDFVLGILEAFNDLQRLEPIVEPLLIASVCVLCLNCKLFLITRVVHLSLHCTIFID